jgi:hypothetical protein
MPKIDWQGKEADAIDTSYKTSQGERNRCQYLKSGNECMAFVKEEMYSISGIESIYVSIDGESVDIWILIPERDIDLVQRIIEKENRIIDRFINEGQTQYLFDFHVLYQCQATESELVPTNSIKIPKST